MEKIEYKDYTITEYHDVFGKVFDWMFYKTLEGEQHDYDFDDGVRIYCGNCKFAATLEDAKLEIDELN